MEFIARAGTFIDRSHRVAGFFLIVAVVLTFAIMKISGSNAKLSSEIKKLSQTRQVYVVPGSQAGFYAPTKPEMLLQNFGQYIIQSLNTYTHTNLQNQFAEVQQFFTPTMLLDARPFYKSRIQDARQDEHSSLFIPERDSLKIKEVDPPKGADKNFTYFKYTVEGNRKDVIGAQVVSARPIRIHLIVRQQGISKSNPWGFILARYREEPVE